MAEKDTPLFGGFEALSGMINPPKEGGPIIGAEEEPELTEEEIKAKLEADKLDDDVKSDGKPKEKSKTKPVEDDEEDVDDVDETDEDVEDISEAEPEIAGFVAEKLADEMGWSFDKDDKFESIGDIVDYMAAVVEESSKPTYANDEVQKFDEFVRDGGDLRSFYNDTISGRVDIDNVDLEVAENQRAVVREHLRNQGQKEDRINRTITRYEDAELLSGEADEALELLKEYNERIEQKLLDDQKNYADDYRNQQQKFFSDVEKGIKDTEDIRGYKINEKQKKELLEYIFKPVDEGRTKYQTEYAASVGNLIESAFMTKEGDTLFKKVEEKAKSDAYKTLHKKLKVNKGRNKSSQQDVEGASTSLSILGNQLFRKPS